MRIGLSPSPPPPVSPEASTSSAGSRPELQRATGGRTRTPRRAPPPNRFSLRDSDTSETSGEDSEFDSDDDGHGDDKDRTPRGKNSSGGRRVKDADDNWEFDSTAISPASNPNRRLRTKEEQWEQDEFYAAVRLRQRRDPVQEYEDRTRKEAWKLAHIRNREQWLPITTLLDTTPEDTTKRLAELNARQIEEVRLVLEEVTLSRKREQDQRRAEHDRQDRELRESIERSIAAHEEARLKKEEQDRLAAGRKAKEEAEARQRQAEAEAKARAVAVNAQEEAEKVASEKKRVEEEEQKKKAEERVKREEEVAKLGAASAAYRPMIAEDELQGSRNFLTVIKSDVMPQVKSTKLRPDVQPNPEWKKELTKLRRQIIPKIGQITNTPAAVERISSQLDQILAPSPRHPQPLYVALLYVVSKAVLKQAEEEVTAKPSTAFPLARVVMALVERGHDLLGRVFVVKLISMSSHWIVGMAISREPNQSDEDYRKSLGYRPASSGETTPQYIERMGGLVTLYAAILQTPIQTATSRETAQRIPAYLRFPRFWTWLARLVGNSDLMSDSAASHILACALETAGDRAMEVWGKQMVKLRAALGRKAFEADGSVDLLGGEEGKAGRIRLGLLLDAWQKNGAIHPPGREYDE